MKNKLSKILIIILSVGILSGCGLNLQNTTYEDICKYITSSKREMYNQVNKGYKYYVPRNMNVSYVDDFNNIIKSDKYNYYLYVDIISYYNKIESTYEPDKSIYYSNYVKDKEGLVNITKLADSYLIVINYNYAKIEVKSSEKDLNKVLSNALIIINSIRYNDDVIKALLDEGVLSINEKVVDVFASNGQQNDLLEIEEDDFYYEDEEAFDRDYIN